ncbi:RNA recognition motif domain-containing protein [Ditylenchus destructor]|nr:RNA recognition motif domain-containing protein [Ditylenchus destructor]
MDRQDSGNFVRLRGLPYSASEKDVRDFFEGLKPLDIMFINSNDGRPAGECYVEFESKEDVAKAMEKHQQNMGKRYIEVFTVSGLDLNKIMRRQQQKQGSYGEVYALRIRGLPFSCKKDDIINFFTGFQNSIAEIILGRERGGNGRPTGEAFVRFNSKESLDGAMQFDGKHMGTRYLELFRSDGEAFHIYKQRMMSSDAMPSFRDFERDYGRDRFEPGYDQFEPRRFQTPSVFDQYPPNDEWAKSDYHTPSRDFYTSSRAPTRLADIPHLSDYGYESNYARAAGGGYSTYGRRADDYYLDAGRSYDGPLGGRSLPMESSYRDNLRYSPYDHPSRNAQSQRSQISSSYTRGYDDVRGSDEFVTPTKVHMRGLPFRITAKEIERFFEPLQPIEVKVGYFEDGRSAGDAIVEFSTMAEARVAVEKDRQMIGNRYIELFPASNMKIVPGTLYKTVGGRPMHKPQPAPLSGYQWSSY